MSETTLHPADEAHESRDVHRRGLVLFALAFGAFLVVSIGVLWLLFGVREGGFSAAQWLGRAPDNGELQQREQLARYLGAQNAELERLAWTDGSKQFAKLPIEDAMKLLAAKGAAR